MTSGVLYLLSGTSHAARLAVSVISLRRHYDGPVCLVTSGSKAAAICEKVRADRRLRIGDVIVRDDCAPDKKSAYLYKIRFPEMSAYDRTVYLDCDTLVTGDLAPLFQSPSPEHIVVTQFCDWRTDRGIVSRRIRSWMDTHPELVGPGLEFGPAINAGVLEFTRQSAIFEPWSRVAQAGRHHFIPDEVALQLLLPHYPHVVLDGRFNCSPKYGDPKKPDTRIVHFHGNKHLADHTDLWARAFEEAYEQNIGGIRGWAPAGDQKLAEYLRCRMGGALV